MPLIVGTEDSSYFAAADRLKQNMDYAVRLKQQKKKEEEDAFYRFVEMADKDPSVYQHVAPQIEAYAAENPDAAPYLQIVKDRQAQYEESMSAQQEMWNQMDGGGQPQAIGGDEWTPRTEEVVTPWGSGPIMYQEPPPGSTEESFRPEGAGPPPTAGPASPLSGMSTGELSQKWHQLPPGPAKSMVADEIKRRTTPEEPLKPTGTAAQLQYAVDQGWMSAEQAATAMRYASELEETPEEIAARKRAEEGLGYERRRVEVAEGKEERLGEGETGTGTAEGDGLTYFQNLGRIEKAGVAQSVQMNEMFPEVFTAPLPLEVTKRITSMVMGKLDHGTATSSDLVTMNLYGNDAFVKQVTPLIAEKTGTDKLNASRKISQAARKTMALNPWMSLREATGYIVHGNLQELGLTGGP